MFGYDLLVATKNNSDGYSNKSRFQNANSFIIYWDRVKRQELKAIQLLCSYWEKITHVAVNIIQEQL